ncbi:MAG: AMP-binding protein [Candidatus Binatia bacterium]
MTVLDAIEAAARSHGARTALVELAREVEADEADTGGIVPGTRASARNPRHTSYAELHDRVLRACTALEEAGVLAGDRLAVLLDNSIDMVVTEWACLIGGYLWVALNVRSSVSEQAAILADSTPALLVAGEPHAELAAELAAAAGCRILVAGRTGEGWDAFVSSSPARGPRRISRECDPVRIRYTSGTAGRPKGAVLTRGCYDASLETVSRVIAPVETDDVLLQVAPMTHASGAMFLPHAVVRARALLASHFDATRFAGIVERHRVTAVFLVPTMVVRLIELLDDGSARMMSRTLRTIVYGGASMPIDRLIRGLELLGPVFVQIYGLTESTWPVTWLSRQAHQQRVGEADSAWRARLASCGSPTPIGELRIVTEDGREAAVGESGEIRVRGRNTMMGYWRTPAESAPEEHKGLDSEGWMHTGDVGRRGADGNVTIVDRLHDMIVTGGFNVYPREVEDVLSNHPAVLESAVVGRPDAEWGETVHAFVVLRTGADADSRDLLEHCARVLAGYKKPRTVELVAALPKNASGKILRRALRERLGVG